MGNKKKITQTSRKRPVAGETLLVPNKRKGQKTLPAGNRFPNLQSEAHSNFRSKPTSLVRIGRHPLGKQNPLLWLKSGNDVYG
jgi:hypothetical protein